MYFPVYTLPNFYEDPHEVVKFANTLKYPEEANDGIGFGTVSLHHFHPKFFRFSNEKILKMIYGPLSTCNYVSRNIFCKIKDKDTKGKKKGSIHFDKDTLLTVMIYLSDNLVNSGTNVYVQDSFAKPKLLSSSQGSFNTAFCFDGCYPHQAMHNLKLDQERLVQSIFFTKLNAPYFPLPEINRTNI